MSVTAGLGWSEDQFWKTSLRYISAAVVAETNRYRRGIENARIAGFLALVPHLSKGASITKVFPLPWEQSTAPSFDNIDAEALEKFNREADEWAAKNFAHILKAN